jgi:TetR/AcrR family transcriptional regulator, transcriptional repressor for nem operon
VPLVARTKAFDPEVAVERARDVFWAKGYAATSTQDLVDALGINRSSLYATFGSKRELYSRALESYGRAPAPRRLEDALKAGGPLKPRLRAALMAAAEEDLDPRRSRGCFACNAAVELGPSDAGVRRLVTRSFRGMRDSLRVALERAKSEGEISSDADVDALASQLLATIEGLHVLAKGTHDRRMVEQAIEATVAPL